MKEILASIAAALAIAGNVPYVVDILKRRVQPHAYTWFVWTIVSAIVLFGQLAKGAGVGALPTAASEVFTILIFLLSLRYGFKRVTKTDTAFLLIALCGLIPWVLTKDPTISVVIGFFREILSRGGTRATVRASTRDVDVSHAVAPVTLFSLRRRKASDHRTAAPLIARLDLTTLSLSGHLPDGRLA